MDLQEAKQRAIEVMIEYGLAGWRFDFDDSAVRFGLCSYRKRTIFLSRLLTERNSVAAVHNIILHEVAHALCPHHRHDDVWRAKFRSMGGNGERCYDNHGQQPVKVEKPWKAVCRVCGAEFGRIVRPTKPYACTPCCRKYNKGKWHKQFVLVWFKGRPMTQAIDDIVRFALGNVQGVNN